ncbi:MAG: hypothetical protein OXG84_14365 [Chloroflexi bacterium]|nr:hypothetical protein [Chloroflexota bacterium]
MNGKNYTQFMAELDTIAEKIKAFPDSLHESVYSDWRKLLLDMDLPQAVINEVEEASQNDSRSSSVVKKEEEDRNYASEIADYYEKYKLSERNDMELSAFVAYYFTVVAPQENKVDAINEGHLVDLCTITGRRIPGRPAGSLSNAKNLKRYLDRVGIGTYSLTKVGEHFVRHTLLKKAELEVQNG